MWNTKLGRLLAVGFVAILGATALAGCGGNDEKKLTIGYIAWDEDIAISQMWKKILEDQGYTVDLKELEVGLIFEGLANGDIDVFLDMWLPTTHKKYWNENKDVLERYNVWYDDASLEITVPSYIDDINSISDLPANADRFDNQIIGIEKGAGLTTATQDEVLPDYGLKGDMKLTTSGTPAMLSELDSAIANNEDIVVTLWHPHWAYSKYDLKDLKDPKKSLGGAESLYTVGRDGLTDEKPKIVKMLKKFRMNDKQLSSLEELVVQKHKDDPQTGVKQWLKDNPDYTDSLK